MDEEILDPLGMDDATFIWSARVESKLATEHLVSGKPVPVYRQAARAHGSLYATVEDIGRFVAAGTEGTGGDEPGRGVLASDSVAELHTPVVETTGFYALGSDTAGLGHFVETLPDGHRAVAHGGQGMGSWSWYHAVPETGDGIVVLTNSERSLQLIADVAGMWADRMGFFPVKLSRAAQWVRVPSWIVGLVAVGLAVWLGYGIITGKLTFDPLCDRDRTARAVLGGLAVAVLGLWWSMGREFVSHFLPVIADWVGSALSVFAGLVLLRALFPRTGDPAPGR
ncbi:serine hydrolase domain-containing protein [Coleofasciculus sp.]|uniref:serine hydrolase domain-containing protein n=1 Tax=Coleofasciculus sp. TaxID=3100458 RepID=UPI003A45F76B